MPVLPFQLPGSDLPLPGDPVHDLATQAEAIARLITEYQLPNLQAFVGALAAPAQDLEDAFYQLLTERSVFTAVGAQEDVLGKIVGAPRGGLDDDTYRLVLLAQIAANKSSGSTPELYGMLLPLLPVNGTLAERDLPPASFTLTVGGAALTALQAQVFANLVRQARGAAIGGELVWSLNPPSGTFTLDGTSSQALDHGGLAEASP